MKNNHLGAANPERYKEKPIYRTAEDIEKFHENAGKNYGHEAAAKRAGDNKTELIVLNPWTGEHMKHGAYTKYLAARDAGTSTVSNVVEVEFASIEGSVETSEKPAVAAST